MKVVICEKPSVGRDIAHVLGANNKNDGYMEGNGYAVTWAFGHLFQLANPEAYDEKYKSWDFDLLPIMPDSFKLNINEDAGAKKQFKTIKTLVSAASSVINAGDAGREGELIQRYILQMAGYRGKVERLWITSLTEEAIKEGFKKLLPSADKDNLFLSGKARGEADWLIGMNSTRALTSLTQSQNVLSLGRVQTPVMAMVCKRFLENKNFTPVPYFVPTLELEKSGVKFKASFKGAQILNRVEADKILTTTGSPIICSKSLKTEKIDSQPYLFDLTSLQSFSNTKFGYSAQKTLDLMQGLYETHKVLTYPRTDSKYISEDIFRTLPNVLDKVSKIENYGSYTSKLDIKNLPKKSVDDSKVSDHHAIIPTGQFSDKLDKDEKNIYDLVVRRFIAAFSNVCKKMVTTYEFGEGSNIYQASGTLILVPGWRQVEQELKEDDTIEEENQSLPDIALNEKVVIIDKKVLDKKTQKPPLYTEATLLKAMETCGKELDDKELTNVMKGSGIGTPATRASIIETLISRKYIDRESKKIIATELALSIYEQIKDLDIASPVLTGKWEMALTQIEEGKIKAEVFNEQIKKYTHKIIHDLKLIAPNIKIDKVVCPKCGQGQIVEGQKAFGCNRWKEGCDFKIWKEQSGKKISFAIAKKMIANGEVSLETIVKQTDDIGEYKNKIIRFGLGKFGPYLSYNNTFISLSKDAEKPNLSMAIELIEKDLEDKKAKKNAEADAVVHMIGKKYQVFKLDKGYYLKEGQISAPLKFYLSKHEGKEVELIKKLDEKQCKEIIAGYVKWKKGQK